MEIVTEPDLRDGTDAAAMVREMQLLLQAIGTCDGKMDGRWENTVNIKYYNHCNISC